MSTAEQQHIDINSNFVFTVVASCGKMLQEYEAMETATIDTRMFNELQMMYSCLTRLLKKHQLDVDLVHKNSINSAIVKQPESIPTLETTNGEIIKQRKVENKPKLDEAQKRVLKTAEESVRKAVYTSDEEGDTKNELLLKVTTSNIDVLDDPHIIRVASDVYKCDVCSIKSLSYANAQSHVNGKAHRNKVKQMSRDSSASRIDGDKPSSATEWKGIEILVPGSLYRCSVCKVSINSEQNAEQHVNGAKHKKEMAIHN